MKGSCPVSSCVVDPDSWVFSNCLLETCTTPGYYTSFGNCESIYLFIEILFSKFIIECVKGCATCSDATTCQSCSFEYYKVGTTCQSISLVYCFHN